MPHRLRPWHPARPGNLLEFNDGVAGRRGAVAAVYFLQGALRRAV